MINNILQSAVRVFKVTDGMNGVYSENTVVVFIFYFTHFFFFLSHFFSSFFFISKQPGKDIMLDTSKVKKKEIQTTWRCDRVII